jgi:hypothetical protein
MPARRQQLRPLLARDAMERSAAFTQLDRLGDGIEDERMRGLPGPLGRGGDTCLRVVVKCGRWL